MDALGDGANGGVCGSCDIDAVPRTWKTGVRWRKRGVALWPRRSTMAGTVSACGTLASGGSEYVMVVVAADMAREGGAPTATAEGGEAAEEEEPNASLGVERCSLGGSACLWSECLEVRQTGELTRRRRPSQRSRRLRGRRSPVGLPWGQPFACAFGIAMYGTEPVSSLSYVRGEDARAGAAGGELRTSLRSRKELRSRHRCRAVYSKFSQQMAGFAAVAEACDGNCQGKEGIHHQRTQ